MRFVIRSRLVGLLVTGGAILSACGSDSLKPEPRIDDESLYWDLSLSHHAVTLSVAEPYDTLRLTAVPRNYLKEAIAGLPVPEYVSRDVEKVSVTTEGLLTAHAPTSQPVWVIAVLTTENLRHADSVLIKVDTASSPTMLAGISIHPLPPDTAKVGASMTLGAASGGDFSLIVRDTLTPRATSSTGASFDSLVVGGIPVFFRSADTLVAKIDQTTGVLYGIRPGVVEIYASTTVFGVMKADTLAYRVGWPVFAQVGVLGTHTERGGVFFQPDLTVGAGANVRWIITESEGSATQTLQFDYAEVDITFSSDHLSNIAPLNLNASIIPSNVFAPLGPTCFVLFDCTGDGNIVLGGGVWSIGSSVKLGAIRSFPFPGVYNYGSTIHGTTARITVVDES